MQRMSTAVRIGIGFGLLGIALTIVGILRGNVPPNPASIGMALLIGGGVWFLVSWAVATAAQDVEKDMDSAYAEHENNQEEYYEDEPDEAN